MALYRIYGLNVASEVMLEGLPQGEGTPDVTIRYGELPEFLGEAVGVGVCFQTSPGRCLLSLDGVGKFLASNGNEIVLDPVEGADERAVRVFMLGAAMGAVLQQRGMAVLHGSAVAINGSCICLIGNSGAGKSTLAARLHEMGYEVLSDDICAIGFAEDGQPMIYPGPRELAIWMDAATQLGFDPGALTNARPEQNKFIKGVDHDGQQTPIPLKWIYVLTSNSSGDLLNEELIGGKKFANLAQFTYRKRFLMGMGLRKDYYRHYMELASRCSMTLISRPQGRWTVDELAGMVIKGV